MAVIQLSKDNFDAEVLQSDQTVLVDFYADWCGPCKMLAPILQELAEESAVYKICKLNIDEAPELAARYNVMSIPTMLVVKGGTVVQQMVGLRSKEAIKEMLQ